WTSRASTAPRRGSSRARGCSSPSTGSAAGAGASRCGRRRAMAALRGPARPPSRAERKRQGTPREGPRPALACCPWPPTMRLGIPAIEETSMSAVASKPASPSVTPSSARIFNFSAGPGCLPEEVLQQAQQDIWNIAGSGVGILEHSHRAKVYDKVLAEAEADCRKIANIPANYKVLFLTGGATSQNFMVPANLLAQD